MEQNEQNTTPRIYVASLADYNAGRLHGRWIDANQDAAVIKAAISEILAQSTEPFAEEWAIHDYENFLGLELSEYEDIERVAEVAPLIIEHGELFGKLVTHFGGLENLEDAKRYMEFNYQGCYGSVEEYAREYVEDCSEDLLKGVPDFIKHHIDYEGIGRDFELSGDILSIEEGGEVHIFKGNQ